jgi:hypothetical protein
LSVIAEMCLIVVIRSVAVRMARLVFELCISLHALSFNIYEVVLSERIE